MESYLKCENCQSYFNLSNHKPILFMECLDTVCLECVKNLELANQFEDNQYKCCLNNEHIETIQSDNYESLKVNQAIIRNIESQKKYPIACQVHESQIAQYLVKNQDKIVCEMCLYALQQECSQDLDIREISKVGIKRYASESIEFLEKGIQILNLQKSKMLFISQENIDLKGEDVIQMLNTNQKLFQSTLQNQDDLLQIDKDLVDSNFIKYKQIIDNQVIQNGLEVQEVQQNSQNQNPKTPQ